jgi:hypothetical protein
LPARCWVAVKASERIVSEARELAFMDPCQNPLYTLVLLSCKLSYLLTVKREVEARAIRSILFNLYALYSPKLSLVLDEASLARGVRAVILRSSNCKPDVKVLADDSFRISVKGCDVEYDCECVG